jgi:hypothetical protein
MFEQAGSFVSMPLLAVLVFWLTAIFTSFGLFAPRNATALVTYSSARYRFQVRFS